MTTYEDRISKRMLDLGSGYLAELRYLDGELQGADVGGPQGAHCNLRRTDGRCWGWASVAQGVGGHAWELVSEEPLTLKPSLQCSCNLTHPGEGQHGFISAGRWVNAGGILGKENPLSLADQLRALADQVGALEQSATVPPATPTAPTSSPGEQAPALAPADAEQAAAAEQPTEAAPAAPDASPVDPATVPSPEPTAAATAPEATSPPVLPVPCPACAVAATSVAVQGPVNPEAVPTTITGDTVTVGAPVQTCAHCGAVIEAFAGSVEDAVTTILDRFEQAQATSTEGGPTDETSSPAAASPQQ